MSNIFDEALLTLDNYDIDFPEVIKLDDYNLIHDALERGKKLEELVKILIDILELGSLFDSNRLHKLYLLNIRLNELKKELGL